MKHLSLSSDMFISLDKIKLQGISYNHIIKSLRNKKNDIVIGFYKVNNSLMRYTIRIDEIHSSYALASVLNKEKAKSKKYNLTLIVSYPKERAVVPLIEKTSELGTDAILFVQTKYSQRAFPKSSTQQRYERIAVEASQQSGRMEIPSINYINSLEKINYSQFSCKLCAYEHEKQTFFDLFCDKQLNALLKNVCIFIGPEGGIAKEELNILKRFGFLPVGLGENILRVETAAISLTFLIRYLQAKYVEDSYCIT